MRVDEDGRLHVASAPITAARVCSYLGSEIPGGAALGLTPSRTYALLRPADELRKAADTFCNLPVLLEHEPVTVANPRQDLVCGSTGTDVEFDPPYLRCSIVLWTADAIKGVETGRRRDVSAGYRYRPEMTPGTFEGESYDGVMTEIVGQHIALVREGRNGADVSVIGDGATRSRSFSAAAGLADFARHYPQASRIVKEIY